MVKITLTEDQANEVIQALQYALDLDNFGKSDPFNKKIQRIINKIRREL